MKTWLTPFLDKNTHGFLLKTKPEQWSLLPRNKALREKSRLLRPEACGLLWRLRSRLDKANKVPPGPQGENRGVKSSLLLPPQQLLHSAVFCGSFGGMNDIISTRRLRNWFTKDEIRQTPAVAHT